MPGSALRIYVLLDHLLSASAWSDLIDDQRIGATGFPLAAIPYWGWSLLMATVIDASLLFERRSWSGLRLGFDAAVDYSSVTYKDPRQHFMARCRPIDIASLQSIDQAVALIAAADDELVNLTC